MIPNERTRIISALGLIEIFAWGSSYYLLAVLAKPIALDTGWSLTMITAGVSIGLLASGIAAGKVGRLIEAKGGRHVLTGGMLLIAFGLGLMGLAQSVPVYLAAWVLIGLGMAGGLYDAAFSTLGHLYGREACSAITQLTLWGGFASTICWPVSAWLLETVGWRGTCFAYALLHLLVTAPLCRFALPRAASGSAPPVPVDGAAIPAPGAIGFRFWCLATAGTVLTVLVSIWSVHFVSILTATGTSLAAAVGLGTLIGPAQVGARVLEMLGRSRHHPVWTMAAAVSLVLVGFSGLVSGLSAAMALLAYGAGNGLWSIARGALPLALFGGRNYAVIMGQLATPMLVAASAAPLIGAFLIDRLGAQGTLQVLALAALIPCAATVLLWLDIGRERQPS